MAAVSIMTADRVVSGAQAPTPRSATVTYVTRPNAHSPKRALNPAAIGTRCQQHREQDARLR